jgi:hypothetical protein
MGKNSSRDTDHIRPAGKNALFCLAPVAARCPHNPTKKAGIVPAFFSSHGLLCRRSWLRRSRLSRLRSIRGRLHRLLVCRRIGALRGGGVPARAAVAASRNAEQGKRRSRRKNEFLHGISPLITPPLTVTIEERMHQAAMSFVTLHFRM